MEKKEEFVELTFIEWYSGMSRDKIIRAYKRWQSETNSLPNGDASSVSTNEHDGNKCEHRWIVNTHNNTKYCSKGCDSFKKHKHL